jgi:AcrR family transcriptional regulator
MKESFKEKKERKNSRDLILKEAFKLFLQKNVEKVTVPDLEKATGVQRGAIFYHFKDKEALFIEVIDRYFFSELNIFHPLNPKDSSSLNEYIKKKNEHLSHIMDWFHDENLATNPYASFFHLTAQAYLYDPIFKDKMSDLLKKDKAYWRIAASIHSVKNKLSFNVKHTGDIFRSAYIEHCFNTSYNGQKIKLFDISNMGDLNLL